MNIENSNFLVAIPTGQPVRMPSGVKDPLWFGLPARFSALRCAGDLTLTAIAAAANVSINAVHLIEEAKVIPKLDTVEAVASVLGVSPAYLAYGVDGKLVFKQRRARSPLPPDQPEVRFGARPSAETWRGVGARLRRARDAAKMSLRQLSALSLVSHQGVAVVEKGEVSPKVSTVFDLALALDVAPGWLAFDDGEGPTREASEPGSKISAAARRH